MASNSFGTLFRITTWGESHGKAIGVVIDGCPAGVPLNDDIINTALARRAPGQSPYTSPRKEKDTGTILSGIFNGQSTGTPICIMIANADADSSKYEPIANLLRPGHANFTYLAKYGIFDYRGGGRASARETAARVAAGAVAQQMLSRFPITVTGYLCAAGQYVSPLQETLDGARNFIAASPVFAPTPEVENGCTKEIQRAMQQHDSVGGMVAFHVEGVPVGWGDPVYEKIEAKLAQAMLSLPACKGFEIGLGFAAAQQRGSTCNDSFTLREGNITTASNHGGGVLGGITTGNTLYGRIAFKPTPSIVLAQETLDTQGNPATFKLPQGSRHDPCVAIRAVPVVEAMCWLVLADTYLLGTNSAMR